MRLARDIDVVGEEEAERLEFTVATWIVQRGVRDDYFGLSSNIRWAGMELEAHTGSDQLLVTI